MTQEITITKNVIKTGDSYAIIIPQEVARALDIIPGDLIQAKLLKIIKELTPQSIY
jgi:antitoxin component of MazEF toxin-antitoxin module